MLINDKINHNNENKYDKKNIKAIQSHSSHQSEIVNLLISDRVLYSKKTGEVEENTSNLLGGDKITLEEACVSFIICILFHVIKKFSIGA